MIEEYRLTDEEARDFLRRFADKVGMDRNLQEKVINEIMFEFELDYMRAHPQKKQSNPI